MSRVTIKNMGNKPVTIPLRHDQFCIKAGECRCKEVAIQEFTRNPITGERKGIRKMRHLHHTLIVPVGKEISGLHEAVRSIPEVQAALAGKGGVKIAISSDNKQEDKANTNPPKKGAKGGKKK